MLNFRRLAITKDQIERYDLPTKPRKATDRRSRHITETVEAEAMPAGIMRQMVREAIEAFLPTNALKVARVAEESERSFLLTMARILEERT